MKLRIQDISKAIGDEMVKLPTDKRLHYAGSNVLCQTSKPFSDKSIDTSLCILKAAMDSFRVGLIKEYQDAGKKYDDIETFFKTIDETLLKMYNSYIENNIDKDMHETDLLADLVGIGKFMVTQSILNLEWILHEDNTKNS
jgi:hypothetical protein